MIGPKASTYRPQGGEGMCSVHLTKMKSESGLQQIIVIATVLTALVWVLLFLACRFEFCQVYSYMPSSPLGMYKPLIGLKGIVP